MENKISDLLLNQIKEQRNKLNAQAFYQTLIGDIDYEKAASFLGRYIQHHPEVKDEGIASLANYLETDPKFATRSKRDIKFTQVLAYEDYVYFEQPVESNESLLDTHQAIVKHLLRFDHYGKIDEHWTTFHIDKLLKFGAFLSVH